MTNLQELLLAFSAIDIQKYFQGILIKFIKTDIVNNGKETGYNEVINIAIDSTVYWWKIHSI